MSTTQTQEQWNWWKNLPTIWKKIFTAHIYFPNEVKKGFNDSFIIENASESFQSEEDLQEVFQLVRLKYYCEFPENRISEIPDFKYHKSLVWIDLLGNTIENIDYLSPVTGMWELNLSENKIRDIKALSQMKELSEVELASNQIESLEALSELSEITNLDLNSNQIKDISPLSGLKNLLWLNLSDNPIEDISPLAELPQLLSLSINGVEISTAKLAWLKQKLSSTAIYH